MKKALTMTLSIVLLVTVAAVSSFAVNKNIVNDRKSAVRKKSVTVAVIRADWCGDCQKLEPVISDLMKEYEGKINFVFFDVTNDETTAAAAAKAKALGLGAFFEANKKMTSTVGVFKGTRQTYKTSKNTDRAVYVTAFNNALK